MSGPEGCAAGAGCAGTGCAGGRVVGPGNAAVGAAVTATTGGALPAFGRTCGVDRAGWFTLASTDFGGVVTGVTVGGGGCDGSAAADRAGRATWTCSGVGFVVAATSTAVDAAD